MAQILVVDDDKMVLKGMALMLRSAGHTVFLAANGVEAMDAITAKWTDLDLVVSDVNMPEIDGITLFLWIAQEFPVLVPGFMFHTSLPEQLEGTERLRNIRRLDKPSGRKELLDIVNEVLAQRTITQQSV